MEKESVKRKVIALIDEMKGLINAIEARKNLENAQILSNKKVEFSHFTREIYSSYGVDTRAIKYRCDAVSSVIGHAAARGISKEWFENLDIEYSRWMERAPGGGGLLSKKTVRLMDSFRIFLYGMFKNMYEKYGAETPYQKLSVKEKAVFDLFFKKGCEALSSLYDDFRKALLDGISNSTK